MWIKHIRNYKEMDLPVKAAFWFVICSLIQKAFSFITVPIFTRIMSTDQYGLYSTYLSWSSILAVVATLNLESGAYSNAIGKSSTRSDINKITISYLTLGFFITTVLLIICMFFIDTVSLYMALSPVTIFLMLIEMYVIPIARFWNFKQRFDYRFISVVTYTMIYSVTNLGLGVLFTLNADVGDQAEARIMSVLITEMSFGILFYIALVKEDHIYISTYKWKETLSFQLPLIPYYLSMDLLLSADRIMIQRIVGAMEAGIYSVAYSAGQIMTILKMCIIDAIRPWIYKNLEDRSYIAIGKLTNGLTVLVMILSILFSIFAPEFIKILAAPQYYDAIYVIPPVALSASFTFVYQVFAVIETYYSKTTSMMKASILAAVTNIILNYIFIPKYGYIVAGYTTLISYIVLCYMHYKAVVIICIEKNINRNIFDTKFIVTCLSLGVMLSVIVSFLYKYIYVRYCVIIVLILFSAINKNRIKIMINRIRSR